jgi:hypothetical protein
MRCSRCKTVSYCGSLCQRMHWPAHKASCAEAAAESSGQASSSSSSIARTIGLSTEEPAVQVAEPASGAQQTEPEPPPAAGGSNTKKDKERLRKERQRQRKIEEASEALDRAMALLAETRGSVKAVEEAMEAAAKHDGRSEPLTALLAEAKGMVEQARAAEAERARVAAEEEAVKAGVEAVAEAAAAAERLQMEERLAALALEAQQIQARLGGSAVPPAAPAPHPDAEETMCVVCFDAPKDHAIVPCGHICVCEACAEKLTKTRKPTCPVCREPIQQTMKVFCS